MSVAAECRGRSDQQANKENRPRAHPVLPQAQFESLTQAKEAISELDYPTAKLSCQLFAAGAIPLAPSEQRATKLGENATRIAKLTGSGAGDDPVANPPWRARRAIRGHSGNSHPRDNAHVFLKNLPESCCNVPPTLL